MNPDLCIITTGGTFDKEYPPDKGSYAFVFGKESSVLRILARARLPATTVTQLPPQDSLSMRLEDRERIAKACEDALEARIVVTHGTDTMIETASVIARYVADKRIVLTGAAQPEAIKETDADFNLGFAIGVAQASDESGVFIAMNGRVFEADNCIKLDSGLFVHTSLHE